MRTVLRGGLWAAAIAAAGGTSRASYIEALYPLQQILAESEHVMEGTVEKVDTVNQVALLSVGRALKGRQPPAKIRINVGVGRDWHPEVLMRHLVPEAPVVVFLKSGTETRVGMVYLNRFFFQIFGEPGTPADRVWWNFTNIEIRMNRTFHGTPEELVRTLRSVLSGRSKPPPADPRMPPIRRHDLVNLPPWGQKTEEKDLPLPFRSRPPLKPRDPDPVEGLVPGIRFEYYELEPGPQLPDLGTLNPKESGILREIDLSRAGRPSGIALRFTGFLEVPQDGVYLFYLTSDGLSRMWIGDLEPVVNEGRDRVLESAGDAFLKTGRHGLRLEYINGAEEKKMLRLEYEGPGLSRRPVPGSALFYKP